MRLLSDARDFLAAIKAALAPSRVPTVLDWARNNYRLSAEDSATPGLVILEPWQEAVLAEYDKPTTSKVIVAASSQVGKTLLGLIIMCHAVKHYTAPMIYLHENDISAAAFAADRIDPALNENVPELVTSKRGVAGGNSTSRKAFSNGTVLSILGAQSASKLSGRPARLVIGTEVRGYPTSVDGEGDPLGLLFARLKSFPNNKAFLESSPGAKGRCRVTEEAERGDMRRWFVRCPHCSHEATIRWAPEDQPGAHFVSHDGRNPEAAQIACGACGSLWTAQERIDAIRAGSFIPTKETTEPGVVSFMYGELVSARSSLADIVRRYFDARGRVEKLQTWCNTTIGEVFDSENAATKIDPAALLTLCEQYSTDPLPENILALTAGVDTQPDRHEVTVLGHTETGERYVLSHVKLLGDTSAAAAWNRLASYLDSISMRHPLGGSLALAAAAIDTGGHNTQMAYDFAAGQMALGKKYFGIKGVGAKWGPITRRSNTYLRKGDQYRLVLVNVDPIKADIFASIDNLREEKPNALHFHDGLAREYENYFEGVTSEKMRVETDKKGATLIRFIHDKTYRNEPLDCLVYAIAARNLVKIDFDAIRQELSGEADDLTKAFAKLGATLRN